MVVLGTKTGNKVLHLHDDCVVAKRDDMMGEVEVYK